MRSHIASHESASSPLPCSHGIPRAHRPARYGRWPGRLLRHRDGRRSRHDRPARSPEDRPRRSPPSAGRIDKRSGSRRSAWPNDTAAPKICDGKIVTHQFVRNKIVVQNHIVLQSVVGDLLQILLFRSIELTGHDQAPVFGRMLPLVDLPGIEQQVQSLVVPNQTEKERIAFRRIQFEADAGLRTVDDDTEIFESGCGEKSAGTCVYRRNSRCTCSDI